jgi:hypothetical protein
MTELNEAQQQAYYLLHHTDTKEVHMSTGVGVGKTFTLGAGSIPFLSIPNSRGLICSPTVPMMKNSTLPKVEEGWNSFDIIAERDYVINRQIKGVKPYSRIGSENVITFKWGSYAVLTSLDNYHTVNGSEWDWIVVDETRDIRNFEFALGRLRARLRGVTFKKLGLTHKILTASTPPDNVKFYLELKEQSLNPKNKIALIQAESYVNKHNLPDGYIEQLEATLDPQTFKREVLAHLITAQSSIYAYAFTRKVHVGEFGEFPNLPVYVSIDFNVSPMTCVYAQHTPDRKTIRIIGEERLINSDVSELCQRISTRYPNHHRLIFTGDASGRNRTAHQKGMTNWKLIKGYLKLSDGQIRLLSANPHSVDYIVLLNSLLSKHGDIQISNQCKYLIQDLELVQRGDGAEKKPPDNLTGHLFDCLEYYLWTFHRQHLDRFAKLGKFADV